MAMTSSADAVDSSSRRSAAIPRKRRRFNPTPYVFIAPQVILFVVFMLFPLFYAAFLSLHKWDVFQTPRFVGARNYVKLLHDPVFWYALKNTAIYVVGTVPLCIGVGLLLAIGLNRKMPLRTIVRSIYFLPVVVSGVVTALAAIWMFNDNYGLLNRFFDLLSLPRISWNSNPTWAMTSLIISTIWLRSGFCMIIYLAALQGVSPNLYEAAQIDGANGFQRFQHVTWPSMRPVTLLLTILNVIYSFQVFDLIFVMTGGGPGYSTTVLVEYIYNLAFTMGDQGYASAVGVALFVLIMIFTVIQWRLSRRSEAIS